MKQIKYFILFFIIIFSCTKENDLPQDNLSQYLSTQSFKIGKVIACAASATDSDQILVFYYPKPKATHLKYFETKSTTVDKLDFEKYTEINLEHQPFFNGYLGKYTRTSSNEKWIIISYELDHEIHLSNPIRTKQFSKPTFWTDQVLLDQSTSLEPYFTWRDNFKGDNAIYFQVI